MTMTRTPPPILVPRHVRKYPNTCCPAAPNQIPLHAGKRTHLPNLNPHIPALLADGIAIEAFTADLCLETVRKGLAVGLLMLGTMLSTMLRLSGGSMWSPACARKHHCHCR